MLIASLICSDPDCAEQRDVVAASLDAVDREAPCCDCGCTLLVLAVSGWGPAARGPRGRPRLVGPGGGGGRGVGRRWRTPAGCARRPEGGRRGLASRALTVAYGSQWFGGESAI